MNQKPMLIIFVGPPGSGKSTLSKMLEKQKNFIRVATDEIKANLIRENISYNIAMLYQLQYLEFERLAKSKLNIISDSNSGKEIYRNSLIEFAIMWGYEYRIIYLHTSFQQLVRRIEKRKDSKELSIRSISIGRLKNYLEEIEIPKYNFLELDTSESLIKTFNQLIRYIEE